MLYAIFSISFKCGARSSPWKRPSLHFQSIYQTGLEMSAPWTSPSPWETSSMQCLPEGGRLPQNVETWMGHSCLKVILGGKYNSYEDALKVTGLKTLKQRREEKCLAFSLKCLKHPQLMRLFPRNENGYPSRNKEEFKINFAYTEDYRRSAIPYCQTLLNHRSTS